MKEKRRSWEFRALAAILPRFNLHIDLREITRFEVCGSDEDIELAAIMDDYTDLQIRPNSPKQAPFALRRLRVSAYASPGRWIPTFDCVFRQMPDGLFRVYRGPTTLARAGNRAIARCLGHSIVSSAPHRSPPRTDLSRRHDGSLRQTAWPGWPAVSRRTEYRFGKQS